MVDHSDAAGADLEAGHDRTQDHGAVPAGLYARKLRPPSALRRRAPTWVPTPPTHKALHDKAPPPSMFVAYTLPGGGKIIDEAMAPREGELFDQKPGGPDKSLGNDLNPPPKARGVKTIIHCGTSAQGVGLGTGSGAAQRGYSVIYPVDCVRSESAFREAYAAWHMAGGGPPVTTKWVTVTRSDMITFENPSR